MGSFARGSRPTQFGQSGEVENIDIHIGEVLNVEFDVVVEGPLIFNVKLGSDFLDYLFDFCIS